jgi:beta-lactamase regulating signal transducer with metallopeptidase domain/uncharacterized GH25 family protein
MLKFLAEFSWANQVGWVLVHSLWQFTLVAILALGLQWALQRRSAATRYGALLASMMLMVAMPVATWFSPWSIDPPAVGSVINPVEQPQVVSRMQAAKRQNGAVAMPPELPAKRAAKPQVDDRPSRITPIGLAELLSRVQRQIQPWLPQIVMVWIAGVLVAAQRPLIGLYAVRRLRTVGVSPVGDAVEAVLRRAARRLRLDRAIEVLQSALVETPVVVGYFRPVVLLPLCVVTGLPESQLESILAHELAHIRRGDYAINLLQTVVETIFFYHPAVWWLSHQIRNERENCCDDIAMACVGSRVEYCRALLAVEELRATPSGLSLAAGGGSLWARIRRVAEGEPAPRLAGGSSILCVLIVSTVIFAALAWAEAPVGDPSEPTPTSTKSDVATKVDANLTSPDDGNWKPGQVLDLRIVNARTREPLADVKLELQFSGKGINFQNIKIQTTDAEGRSQIRLPDLRPDAVRVYPTKAGFVPLRIYWDKGTNPALIPKTATVPMQPGTTWGGVVQNEKGEPIPGVKVNVHYWENPVGNPNPHLRANIDEETVTGNDGRWRIDVMPEKVVEDEPRIFLVHDDYVSDYRQRGYLPLPVTEKPSVEALRAQTAVMTMRKGGTITGRVVDVVGQPIDGVRIYNEERYWFKSRKRAATTGKDGSFRITNAAFAQSGINDPPPSTMRAIQQQEVALTVQAPGYAPELIHSDPNGAASPLEISLVPGEAVSGRVLDQEGRPLEGVTVSVSNWLGYRARLELTTKSGVDGRFHLIDAPSSGALYSFYKKGYMAVQDFPMSPQGSEQPEMARYEVTLKAPLTVSGSIVDAATGQPLAKCRVREGVEYDDGRAPEWQQFSSKTITDGQYKSEFSDGVFCRRIRVEAAGYLPAVSRIFRPGDSDAGRVTFDFELSQAVPLSGTILNPDGEPLANAEVYLATNLFEVKDGKASAQTQYHARNAQTDAIGQFELAPEVEPFYLIVLHDQGYATITEAELASNSRIRIEPWTPDNRNFRVERSPFTGTRNAPAKE